MMTSPVRIMMKLTSPVRKIFMLTTITIMIMNTSPVRTAQTESEPLVARPPTRQRELLLEHASTSLWRRWWSLWWWLWCIRRLPRLPPWGLPGTLGRRRRRGGTRSGRRRRETGSWGGFVRVKIIQIEENRGDPRERRMNEVLSWPLSSDWVLTNTSSIITVLTITLRSRQDGEMLNTVSGGARCIREAFNKCLSWGFIRDWERVSTTGIHWAKVKSLDWRFSKIFWLSSKGGPVEVSFLVKWWRW